MTIINEIRRGQYPQRIRFVLYVVNDNDENLLTYPMNYLRNIAIKRVKTSHYIVLDMDELISSNLETELNKLPNEILLRSDIAIVIPIIMINPETTLPYCCELDECYKK